MKKSLLIVGVLISMTASFGSTLEETLVSIFDSYNDEVKVVVYDTNRSSFEVSDEEASLIASELIKCMHVVKNKHPKKKFAITNIEKVEEKFTAVLIYSRLESEKKIGGKLFRYDSQEAKDIHQGLIRRVKKNFHVEI